MKHTVQQYSVFFLGRKAFVDQFMKIKKNKQTNFKLYDTICIKSLKIVRILTSINPLKKNIIIKLTYFFKKIELLNRVILRSYNMTHIVLYFKRRFVFFFVDFFLNLKFCFFLFPVFFVVVQILESKEIAFLPKIFFYIFLLFVGIFYAILFFR